jgi:hypothetical protein
MSPVVIVAAASAPLRNSSNIASPMARIELPGTNWTEWLLRRDGGYMAAHPAGFSGETQPTAGLLRALYFAYLLTRLYTPPFPTTLYATPKALFTQVPRRSVLGSAGGRAIVQYSASASEKIGMRWTRRSKHSGGSPSPSTPPRTRPNPKGPYLRDGPTSRRYSSPPPRELTLFACSQPTRGRQSTCSRLARSKGVRTPSLQTGSTLAKILSK